MGDSDGPKEVKERLRLLQVVEDYDRQDEFAVYLGFTPTQYGNWVGSKPTPVPMQAARQICRVVEGCSVGWIYFAKTGDCTQGFLSKVADARRKAKTGT